MKHWVVSTTTGWNVGDDIIRQGVFNLMGINPATESVVYYDRCVVGKVGHHPIFLADKKYNAPSLDGLMTEAKGLILAGTPEWANFQQPLWNKAKEYNVPIHVVGVGLEQMPALDVSLKTCTCRDRLAKEYLERFSHEPKMFLDPAFHANYPEPKEEIDIVLNYRANGGNGNYGEENDRFWVKLYEKFRDRIEMVTAHEYGEYLRAKRLFPDVDVFYSSEAIGFQQVYANAKHYIGGRIHGCVQAVATGATASLIYGNPQAPTFEDQKIDCMNVAADILRGREVSPIRTFKYNEIDSIETFEISRNWKWLIDADFKKHRMAINL